MALADAALAGVESGLRRRYLGLLARRLAALRSLAAGGALPPAFSTGGERRVARAALRAVEGEWSDGDENAVRGLLGDWAPVPQTPGETAARLLRCVEHAAATRATAGSVRFHLWLMESVVAGLVESASLPAPPR